MADRAKRDRKRHRTEHMDAEVGTSTSSSSSTWRQFDLPIVLSLFSLWAALPPLNWWPLAWLFPLPWILIVRPPRLPARRPYLRIWLWGGLYWIAVLQGVRLAHWANYFGLIGLGLYFGAFWPLFAGMARALHHRLRVPLPLAASGAWVGAEWLRGQGPVGFSGAALGHTQVHWTAIIQVADLAGASLVSWMVVTIPLCAAAPCWGASGRRRIGWIAAGVVLTTALLGYGYRHQNRFAATSADTPGLRVALIQGSIDTDFGADPHRPQRMMRQYSELTYQAMRKHDSIDLVVWPESMFPLDAVVLESDSATLAGQYAREDLLAAQAQFRRTVRDLVRGLNRVPGPSGKVDGQTWLVLGAIVWHFDDHGSKRYNSALLFDPDGNLRARYDKMHPVLFGEYIPLGETFPWLYRLTPMSNGLTAGKSPVSFAVKGVRLAPSICFESIVPALIREQVNELVRRGEPPQALLNITNDGWFWGSSILDLQLHAAVFRAVENRRPLLIAANTGLSAWIKRNGAIVARGPRHDTGILLATLPATPSPPVAGQSFPPRTVYEIVGDWPWIGCLVAGVCGLAVVRLDGIRWPTIGNPGNRSI